MNANIDLNSPYFLNSRRGNHKKNSQAHITQNRYESLPIEPNYYVISKNISNLPALYQPRERVKRNLNSTSEYADSYDNPRNKLMFNNMATSAKHDNILSNEIWADQQFRNEPQKFSYIDRLNQDTSRSLNLPQGTTSFIPKNYEKSYMSLNENFRSKMNDLFFKNNKTLIGENYKLAIPGYSGFIPSDIKGYRGPDRKYVLSTKED